MACRVTDVWEHLVEEVLCEPARNPLAGLEVASARLKSCSASAMLARGLRRGGRWIWVGNRRSRGREGGHKLWRRSWHRPWCHCGRGAASATAKPIEVAGPPSLRVQSAWGAISVCDSLIMDVVLDSNTCAATSTSLGGLKIGGHWRRCRRWCWRRRRRRLWCWHWRRCTCDRRRRCGNGRRHSIIALAETPHVAWPPRLRVLRARSAVSVCDALLLHVVRLRNTNNARTAVCCGRRRHASAQALALLDHDEPNI